MTHQDDTASVGAPAAAATFRSLLRRVALGVAAALILAAPASAQEITLRITDWQAGVDNILNSYRVLIKEFEESHPGVKIEYTQYSYNSYNEYLKPALASGAGPDIFAIYPGPDVADVAKSGNIVALSDVMDDEWKGWLGKAYDFEGGRWNGKLWIAPQDAQTEVIWVYKDMLAEIGMPLPSFGKAYTVDEWVEIGKRAREKGYDGLMAGLSESWTVHGPYYNMVHQLQPSDSPDMVLQALDGKISWQQDIFRKPIEAFKKLHDARTWREDAIGMDYQVQAWGKWLERAGIGMWANGDWFAGSAPADHNQPGNPNIAIMSYPKVNAGATDAFNWGFGTDLAVYAKGEHQDLALEFVRLTNSPRGSEVFIKNYVVPAASGSVDISAISDTSNPVFNLGIQLFTLKEGRASRYVYPHDEPQRALYDGIINVMLGAETIDDVLANMDKVTGFK